jgi:hypothetical protein
MNDIAQITSDMSLFQDQLNSPNKHVANFLAPAINSAVKSNIIKADKNLVISLSGDSTGCGHIRNIFWMTYLNAVFAKSQLLRTTIIPFFCYQHEILMQARTLFFPRTMSDTFLTGIKRYKETQARYGYKMIYDLDDFIWQGNDLGESIPAYNFSSKRISKEIADNVVKIMGMMDMVCVSTEFLKNYITEKLKIKTPITVLPNTIPRYFYGPKLRKNITEKIKKPKIMFGGSPTHYDNKIKNKGDFTDAWIEFIVKNVKDNKIDFMFMGCNSNPNIKGKLIPPFFFEEIADKITLIPWQNSYQYHLPILEYRPDFWIAPLVPNYFNYSKSDISYITAAASGAVFIGSVFDDMPSPYDNALVSVKSGCSASDIERLMFNELVEPENYNKIVGAQWDMLDRDGRWLESKRNVNLLTKIF